MIVAGRVEGPNMVRVEGNQLQMIITASEALGNCPKVWLAGEMD
jgi:hypothetical protein